MPVCVSNHVSRHATIPVSMHAIVDAMISVNRQEKVVETRAESSGVRVQWIERMGGLPPNQRLVRGRKLYQVGAAPMTGWADIVNR